MMKNESGLFPVFQFRTVEMKATGQFMLNLNV